MHTTAKKAGEGKSRRRPGPSVSERNVSLLSSDVWQAQVEQVGPIRSMPMTKKSRVVVERCVERVFGLGQLRKLGVWMD